jgi:PncC family amidohydrolase
LAIVRRVHDAAALAAELTRRASSIATAESLTGGALAEMLSAAPGSSDFFMGGVVAYATAVKLSVLGVPERIVQEHGVVSSQCAAQMALAVRALLGADVGVSTTGVAGPTTQEGKPVGLVFVGVAGPGGVSTRELHLGGDRARIRHAACLEAIDAACTEVGELVERRPASGPH